MSRALTGQAIKYAVTLTLRLRMATRGLRPTARQDLFCGPVVDETLQKSTVGLADQVLVQQMRRPPEPCAQVRVLPGT